MQASEDAKKLVNQERSFACAEIESARAVVQRIGEALDEQEKILQTSGNQVPIKQYRYSHSGHRNQKNVLNVLKSKYIC